jgi:hypothetical protein
VANIGDYASTYAGFDWETPKGFNFGRDVVDRWAAQAGHDLARNER